MAGCPSLASNLRDRRFLRLRDQKVMLCKDVAVSGLVGLLIDSGPVQVWLKAANQRLQGPARVDGDAATADHQ